MTRQLKFGRGQKLVISLFVQSVLYLQEICATGENLSIFLHKISSIKAVEMESTPCLIKTANVTDRLNCAVKCALHLPECAALYYNDAMKLCKLLRCRPTDKLENQNLVWIPSSWELFEDTTARHRAHNSLECKEGWCHIYVNNGSIYLSCKTGWALFAGHCYYFDAVGSSWTMAVTDCNSKGASLIEIYSQLEEDWVKASFLWPITGVETQCPTHWQCSLWIGASRNSGTSNFSYNSGKPILYPQWDRRQPDNQLGDENCVALNRWGKLHDYTANNYDFQYLCKI